MAMPFVTRPRASNVDESKSDNPKKRLNVWAYSYGAHESSLVSPLNQVLELRGLESRAIPRPVEPALFPSIALQPEHFSDCRALPRRTDLLSVLPRGAKVAEVGVASGDFAAEILRRNQPATLHLVDAWESTRYAQGLERVRSRFHDEIAASSIFIHVGRSRDVLPTADAHGLDWNYLGNAGW